MRRKGPSAAPTPRSGLARLVLRFVLVFLVATAVLAGLWSFIAPGYTTAVTGLARPLFRWVEAPNASVLEARGAEIWIYRIVGPGEIAPFTWFDRYTFFAVIPLLALLIATPGLGWPRRFARLGFGAGGLLLAHVGYLVASVELSYVAIGLTPAGPFLARTLDLWQVGVRVLWEAAPVAIWVLLTLGVWRGVLRQNRGEGDRENLPAGAVGVGG
jgi:hypothetical protein